MTLSGNAGMGRSDTRSWSGIIQGWVWGHGSTRLTRTDQRTPAVIQHDERDTPERRRVQREVRLVIGAG